MLSLSNSELVEALRRYPPETQQLILQELRTPTTEKELCESSLYEFVKAAWDVVEPGEDYKDNWHVEAICRHLEYATKTKNYKLLINIPPGCMKSLLTGVFWPCWVWGPRNWPSARWLFASYSQDLSTRDSVKCRQIIEGEWYKEYWGHSVELAGDNNAKTYYENTKRGWRLATSVGGRGTGLHPDFKVWDDPHNVKQAESDVQRQAAIEWRDGTLTTRGASRGAREVGVMQRVHQGDLSAHVMKEGDWDNLCLPMRYELNRMKPTSIGWTDPRTKSGELLWSSLFPNESVSSLERSMGSIRSAGQLQQRPAPMGGSIFKSSWFRLKSVTPITGRAVRYWDKAGSTDDGDYSVGALVVEFEENWYVVDVIRGQWSYGEREQIILRTAALDSRKHQNLTIWVEQEPGSGGKESAERTTRMLAGYSVRTDKPVTNKVNRWQPWAAQLEAGNVYLIEADWNSGFIEEHVIAPRGSHDDQIDAVSAAFNRLCGESNVDLNEWLDLI